MINGGENHKAKEITVTKHFLRSRVIEIKQDLVFLCISHGAHWAGVAYHTSS